MTSDRLPPSTYLLSVGQALNLTAAVISVSMAAIVGSRLAPSAGWATVPYGFQFAAVMFATYPMAVLMRRWGRRIGFFAGGLLLIAAGTVGFLSVSHASFAGLIAAHGLLGAYIASANFFRFAAVDGLDGANKARAMSWVVAGGVLAALVGPWIASHLRGVAGYAEFSLCYAVLALIGVATILIMVAWRPTHAHSIARQKNRTTAHAGQGIDRWLVGTAIFASAGGYFVMNLLMVQASLVLRDICSFDQTASAIQWHVLAMFAPSFLTGALIERWGLRAILALGALLLSSAALIGLIEPSYATVAAGLLVLGLGWNLAYVGGGAMLARFVPEHLRHHWQGVNDTLIAVCATLGAFAPAPMLAALGWEWTNASCLALTAAMGLICWFILPSEERQRGIEVTNVVSK